MIAKTLLNSLSDFFSKFGFERTYWLAFSGGLDSHVLLELCVELRKQFPLKLRAIHINHNVSMHAKIWAAHCAQICKNYTIEYIEKTIQLDLKPGDSFEAFARDKRYAIFSDYIQEGDVLLTAHHQDDQAETMLLQLFRGAGLKGLAAMPALKPFGKGFHARPLLDFLKSDLESYANEHKIKWIEDESNHDTKLTRNFIRHDIFPLLKKRWPTIATTIARSAAHCSEAEHLLSELSAQELLLVKGTRENTVSVKKLLALENSKQKWLLRSWILRLGFALPDTIKLETIQSDVLTANWDRMPCVAWTNTELRRYKDDLYLMQPISEFDSNQQLFWDFSSPISLPCTRQLYATQTQGAGLRSDLQTVTIRFRQGGEKVSMTNRGSHTLKNLFQEWDVLPWERDRIPLIYCEDKLIGVVGYFIDDAYQAKVDETGFEVTLLS